MKPVYISADTSECIYQTLCKYPSECGGVIACDSRGHIVDFYFDHEAGTGKATYFPSVSTVNNVVNRIWLPRGLRFCGVAHSHPLSERLCPSGADLITAERILRYNEWLEEILLLITQGKNIKVWEVRLNQPLRERKLLDSSSFDEDASKLS